MQKKSPLFITWRVQRTTKELSKHGTNLPKQQCTFICHVQELFRVALLFATTAPFHDWTFMFRIGPVYKDIGCLSDSFVGLSIMAVFLAFFLTLKLFCIQQSPVKSFYFLNRLHFCLCEQCSWSSCWKFLSPYQSYVDQPDRREVPRSLIAFSSSWSWMSK